jgi:hypothetical protein
MVRRLLRDVIPLSRLGLVLWAWRNRASMMDWATFALRAVTSASSGAGLDDAKAEFRLRSRLARDPRTRHALVSVEVDKGVVRLEGRTSPEVHAVIQDMAVATRGIARLDDRISHSLGKGGLLKRRAKLATA